MSRRFQKSADRPHPGILEMSSFQHGYDLHCYEPPEDLKPFVVHIWTQRRRPGQRAANPPLEIQTGPNIYLFVNSREAYIHGIARGTFRYDPDGHEVYAGVKFRPGGFRAFWHHTALELAETLLPAQHVFPMVDALRIRLDEMDDTEIVRALETMLREAHPVADRRLQDISVLMEALETHDIESVPAMARLAHRSERTLRLLFTDYVGVSPYWVLARKRLIGALHDYHSRKNWIDIAAAHGYSSQAHFIQAFKRATGITPSDYRRRLG